ncbi:MAG TPA: YraN family protein [Thermoanaerobaculia bacterium]|nr:YraN family protein [Thermoanaerobaculia bacterium]
MSGRFHDQPHARARGTAGEDEAVRWLVARHGYRVAERNVKTRAGEIDLVARDGDTLCFVEIKARSGATFGPAIGSVGAAKQRRLCRAASLYLAIRRLHGSPCRFDVVGLDWREGGWQYTLVRDAFPFTP